jgi:hypothetical protein
MRSAEDDALLCCRRVQNGLILRDGRFCRLQSGQTEIQHLYPRPRLDHIGGLEIAMNNALLVRGIQRVGELNRKRHSLAEWKRTFERMPIDELHDKVIGTYVVDLANVWMVQGRYGARLPLESRGEFDFCDLDGYIAVKPRVARLPNVTHSPGTDPAGKAVRAEHRAGAKIRLPIRAKKELRDGVRAFEERFHLAFQADLAGALIVQKSSALTRGMLKG